MEPAGRGLRERGTAPGWVGLGWLIVIPGRDPGKPVLLLRNPRPQPPRSSLPLPPCTPDPPPARPPERPRPLCLQHGPLAQQRRGGRGVNCAQELPAALHHPHPPGCHSDHPPAGGGVHKVQRHLRRGGTGRGGTQRSTGKGRKRQLCGREKRERRPGAASADATNSTVPPARLLGQLPGDNPTSRYCIGCADPVQPACTDAQTS